MDGVGMIPIWLVLVLAVVAFLGLPLAAVHCWRYLRLVDARDATPQPRQDEALELLRAVWGMPDTWRPRVYWIRQRDLTWATLKPHDNGPPWQGWAFKPPGMNDWKTGVCYGNVVYVALPDEALRSPFLETGWLHECWHSAKFSRGEELGDPRHTPDGVSGVRDEWSYDEGSPLARAYAAFQARGLG